MGVGGTGVGVTSASTACGTGVGVGCWPPQAPASNASIIKIVTSGTNRLYIPVHSSFQRKF
uniref:Uncharacterized protein n=1 Tax=Caldilinea aerophila TaxID=133453 RepID=A0A7C1FQF9_9CHLR